MSGGLHYPVELAVPGGFVMHRKFEPVLKFGKNEDAAAADGEVLVWDVGTTYPYQTTAQALEIVSDSADDNGAGTGAQTVQVTGLDENWDIQTETVQMNGLTAVDLTGTYIRVYRLALLTAGSGGTNAGTITLRVDGGGSTLASMPAGDGASFLSLMPVPRGYEGFITRYNVSTTFAANSECVIRMRYRDFGGAFRVVDERSINRDKDIIVQGDGIPLKLKPKSDVAITAEASLGSAAVYASFTLLLVPL